MAGGASTYLENALLNLIKGTAFPTAPTNTYVALFTAAPTDAGGGTEFTGGGYARQAIVSATGWSAISGTTSQQISQSNQVTWATATAALGTAVAWGLYDASTAGNLLYWNTLSPNAVVQNGDGYDIAAGNLVVSLGGAFSNYLADALLNWIKGTAMLAAPANLYVALYTAAPTNSTAGTEVTGGSYARVVVASTGWSAISGSGPEQISNSGAINFPNPTANWGVATSWALLDASTGGNMWFFSTLSEGNETINSGDTASFAASALVVSFD